jgi:hypothetical protein
MHIAPREIIFSYFSNDVQKKKGATYIVYLNIN